ncbi:hypothetical protein E7744_01075 [Citricoccus sp. SGAir0253]|uniref:hypothetical protein n=1 Tax=Citricoccus sp. SGAir0253 TaxID=2567881 RepID=UPI0010CCB184|nr:hypothetical protein [Citricoccus sp. SGAir0253]QCU76973.1 hypothetical protein E7744_01075 [Citricoccus sp. SGAir0253]
MSIYAGESETDYEWSSEGEDEGYAFESADLEGQDLEDEIDPEVESELALELLSVSSEEELDQFLGKLARSVVRGAGKFIKSPIGRMVGGALKTVAKTALPVVGSALGSFVAPGIGTAIGGKLGAMAGNLLEAEEAEMMDEAEAEEEAARRYIRFARAAYRNAARTPRSVPPAAAVRAATRSAARTYAPALLRPARPGRPRSGYGRQSYGGPGRTWGAPVRAVRYYDRYDDRGDGDDGGRTEGRWVRRGNRVILLGL